MKILQKKIIIKEFGTKQKKISCGREINKINSRNLKMIKVKKLIKVGRKSLTLPFPKQDKWKMKIRSREQSRVGKLEGWVAMVGKITSKKV
jgi:hypothetical protein